MSSKRLTEGELAASRERSTLRRRLRLLWRGDSTDDEIREELALGEEEFRAIVAEMGLPERSRDIYLPDPATIRRECAIIRSKWSQAERESRLEAAWSARIDNAASTRRRTNASSGAHTDS